MTRAHTLLRWPGGKSPARRLLLPMLRRMSGGGASRLVSPFFGGGAVELSLLGEGWEIRAADACEPLANFWQRVCEDSGKVADIVDSLRPVTPEAYRAMQARCPGESCPWARAAIMFVLNRCAHTGTGLSGGMTRWNEPGQEIPGNPRLNSRAVNRLRSFRAPLLHVEHAGFEYFLSHCWPDGDLAYLDPPYFGAGPSLYDCGVSHESLAEILRGRENWLLSIDDCEQARDLYGYGSLGKVQVRTIQFNHASKKRRRVQELVVSKGRS